MTEKIKTEMETESNSLFMSLSKKRSRSSTFLIYVFGLFIRYILISSKYQSIIEDHIEVSTPLNSWKRVKEGLTLQSHGINPYDGDLVHETPLMLFFYNKLLSLAGKNLGLVFILFDLYTVQLLENTVQLHMFYVFQKQEINKKRYSKDAKEYLVKGKDILNSYKYVVAAYLFNPYTVFNCVGFSTTVFHNFFLALFLHSMLSGSYIISSLALALSSSMSFYTIILALPLFLFYNNNCYNRFQAWLSIIMFVVFSTAITLGNCYLDETMLFIKNVYGFILTVPDLKPNIGLFWYFFIEMFEHFRELFICSFQINVTLLYTIPLSINFRNQPFLLSYALLSLIAVFKSYPSIGDVGFVLNLLPFYIPYFRFWQQGFIVGAMFLVTSILGPIVWHLWIYSHSANVNFYFGVTLAFAVGQIFLLTDTLFAYTKREFSIWYGKKRKINGKEAILALD